MSKKKSKFDMFKPKKQKKSHKKLVGATVVAGTLLTSLGVRAARKDRPQ